MSSGAGVQKPQTHNLLRHSLAWPPKPKVTGSTPVGDNDLRRHEVACPRSLSEKVPLPSGAADSPARQRILEGSQHGSFSQTLVPRFAGLSFIQLRGKQVNPRSRHGRRLPTVSRANGRTLAPLAAPPRVSSIRRRDGFTAATRCECFEERDRTRSLIAAREGDGTHTAVAHAEIASVDVIGPDGVESAVVLYVAVLVNRGARTVPVDSGTVDFCVAPRGRERILRTAGTVPPAPLAVGGRWPLAEQDGIAGSVGDSGVIDSERVGQG